MSEGQEHIENKLKERFSGFNLEPSDNLWASLEQKLDEVQPVKRKGRNIFPFLLILGLLAGGTATYLYSNLASDTSAFPVKDQNTFSSTNKSQATIPDKTVTLELRQHNNLEGQVELKSGKPELVLADPETNGIEEKINESERLRKRDKTENSEGKNAADEDKSKSGGAWDKHTKTYQKITVTREGTIAADQKETRITSSLKSTELYKSSKGSPLTFSDEQGLSFEKKSTVKKANQSLPALSGTNQNTSGVTQKDNNKSYLIENGYSSARKNIFLQASSSGSAIQITPVNKGFQKDSSRKEGEVNKNGVSVLPPTAVEDSLAEVALVEAEENAEEINEEKTKKEDSTSRKPSFDLYFSPEMNYRKVYTNSPAAIAERSGMERPVMAVTAGLGANFHLKEKLQFRTGIAFSHYSEKFFISEEKDKAWKDTSYNMVVTDQIVGYDNGQPVYEKDTSYTMTVKDTSIASEVRSDYSNTYNYIGIPITFRYIITESRKINIDFTGGVIANVWVGGKREIRQSENMYIRENYRLFSKDCPFRPFAFTLQAQLGFSHDLTENLSIMVNPGIKYFLTPVYKSKEAVQTKPYTAGLEMGLRLKL